MSTSLVIEYKDPARPEIHHPFSFQSVIVDHWWPLATQLNLPTLQRLERLHITDVEEARDLARELVAARSYLERHAEEISAASYMRERVSQILPLIQSAVDEWDAVDNITL